MPKKDLGPKSENPSESYATLKQVEDYARRLQRHLPKKGLKIDAWIRERTARAAEKGEKAHNEYLFKIGKLKRDGIDEK